MRSILTRPRSSKSVRAIRIATRRPGRFPHASMGMLVWLTLVWVMLWGNLSVGNFVAGFLLALLVTTIAPFPVTPFDGRFRPWGVVRLLMVFLRDIVHSSFQQATFILRGKLPAGAIIRVHLRSHSDTYLAMISGMTALVPGSVVVDSHRVTGTIYVHVFDTGLAGGIDGVHKTVLDLEERVLRAFASHDELVDAGFVPGSSPRAGRLPTPYAPPTGQPREEMSREQEARRAEKAAAQLRSLEKIQRFAGNQLQGTLREEQA
ncbi:MAG: Na+/H+ antiporter subunit E [Actinomycetaceae bacterium]|nr:Na+/H+ antiporter subunit E [Actinomycetaceae bacterium]